MNRRRHLTIPRTFQILTTQPFVCVSKKGRMTCARSCMPEPLVSEMDSWCLEYSSQVKTNKQTNPYFSKSKLSLMPLKLQLLNLIMMTMVMTTTGCLHVSKMVWNWPWQPRLASCLECFDYRDYRHLPTLLNTLNFFRTVVHLQKKLRKQCVKCL